MVSLVLAPVVGNWGLQGQAGPSHHPGQGADKGECCRSIDMGTCMGPWHPPMESPFVSLGPILRGDISYLCKVSELRFQEGNHKHINLHNSFDEALKLQ